jgi:hypothetical protein
MQRHMLVYLVGLAMSSSLGAAEAQSTNPAVAKPGSAIIDPAALAAVGIHATPGPDSAALQRSPAVGTKAVSTNFFAAATGGAERLARDLGKFNAVDAALPGSAARGRPALMIASAPPRTAAPNADERAIVGASRANAPNIAQGSAIVSGPAPARTNMSAPAARANLALAAERAPSGPVEAIERTRPSMAIGAPAARANAALLAELTPSRAIDANQGARSSTAINARAEPARPSMFVAPGAPRRATLAAAPYGPIVHARPARKP